MLDTFDPAPGVQNAPQPTSTPAATPAPAEPASPGKTAKAAPRREQVSAAMTSIDAKDFGFAQARHLLWRAGFGGTPAQVLTLVSWGPEKSVDYLVSFSGVPGEPDDPDAFDRDIMRPPSAEERAAYRRAQQSGDEDALARSRVMRQNAQQADREQMRRVQQWWLKRMIETGRPLEEKMTLFWHGHFATSYRTIEDSYHMYQQNRLFRRHAVGSFADLLGAIIRDPAMLAYLDQNDSRKNRPNENLAREIMELFSLGVGNYTERDIKEGARALTGYTFEDDEFQFQRNNHDTGSKTILGRSGGHDGDDFVRILLDHKATPVFIATKLYRFFVGDLPSGIKARDDAAALVVRDLAQTLQRSKFQLAPVLRRLFLSRHFYETALRGEQIKSPVQLVVGAVRSLNAPARDLSVLADAINMMGQNIFFPPSVKGWDGGRSWINTSTLYVRQNTLVYLLTGKRPRGRDGTADDEPFNPRPLITQLADAFPNATGSDAEAIIDALLEYALGRVPASRGVLVKHLASRGGRLDEQTLTQLMMLITAMPEYQLC